jgi:hypothetical protein
VSLSFAAGQAALCSGVYTAIHANNHVLSHFMIALHGGTFPNWMDCGNRVRFELALSLRIFAITLTQVFR